MKKILLIAGLGVAVLFGTSCSEKKAEVTDPSEINQAETDSLSILYGQIAATQALQMLQNAENPVDKDAVLKAMQSAFANETSESTLAGIYFAHTLIGNMYAAQQEGIKYDKNKVLNEFKKIFLQDSIDALQAQDIANKFEAINNTIQSKIALKAQAEKEESPEAIQNTKAGEAFINKAKADDPAIKTTNSGLSYKIENPGDDTRATDTDVVSFIYKGMFTDGSVFDESHGQAVEITPAGVIPGMKEGLKMLGKGGKATFYIPGNLAYGVDGVPQANIGPNQMLVFEVEVTDIHPVAQNLPDGK